MRTTLLLAAATAMALASATPPAAPAARAAAGLWCGTGLVAGIALCIGWEMKASEHRALIARANAGDRDAALALAQFEDERDDIRSDGRKWWRRAAHLGECQALRKLRNDAARVGNASVATHWRARIRHFRCAPRVADERWMGSQWLTGEGLGPRRPSPRP